MQTAFAVDTQVKDVRRGDEVWREGGYAKVTQVSWEIDDTWTVWFEGSEPVSFIEDDTLPVKHEVE